MDPLLVIEPETPDKSRRSESVVSQLLAFFGHRPLRAHEHCEDAHLPGLIPALHMHVDPDSPCDPHALQAPDCPELYWTTPEPAHLSRCNVRLADPGVQRTPR